MKSRNFSIVSGNFTESGNFSGYNALGERLHIHGRQMEAADITAETLAFPFFAIGTIKQIGQLDENGDAKLNTEGTAVLVDRLTATSVFTTKAALLQAHIDNSMLDSEVNIAVAVAAATVAKSSGLSEKALTALLSASI